MGERDELPTEQERRKLGELVSFALIEIRRLGWSGEARQAADLADVFHELPREVYGWGRFSWQTLRTMAKHYQEKYPDDPFSFNFVARLDRIHPVSQSEQPLA